MRIKYIDYVEFWGSRVPMETYECDEDCETCDEKCEDARECSNCGCWYPKDFKQCPNCKQ